jgi:hypothetical protein
MGQTAPKQFPMPGSLQVTGGDVSRGVAQATPMPTNAPQVNAFNYQWNTAGLPAVTSPNNGGQLPAMPTTPAVPSMTTQATPYNIGAKTNTAPSAGGVAQNPQ